MFKKIISIWKSQEFLKEIVNNFEKMLEICCWLFDHGMRVWKDEITPEQIREEIYAHDRQLNSEEQRIRKKLIEHLIVNPEVEQGGCLMFMSVIKDAERIGDYTKNIFEMRIIRQDKFVKDSWNEGFLDMEEKIKINLNLLKKAFREGDIDLAREIMETHHNISLSVDEMIRDLSKSNLSSNLLVTYTLITRYLKRVSAHIANIASSIISPLDKIDFLADELI